MPQFNWIVDNVTLALNIWSVKLAEIWMILTQSPEEFKDGEIWNVIVDIHGALQAIGYALLVLFFVIGVVKTAGSFAEMKRPEVAFKMFIRFVLAKAAITYGLELMLGLLSIVQGIISTIMGSSGMDFSTPLTIPADVHQAILEVPFFESIPIWAITLIGGLVVTVLSFIMILSVYGRFFRVYLYVAMSPIALATFAGETTSNVGRSFLRSFSAVALEGAIIALACIIFSAFTQTDPVVVEGASVGTIVWTYLSELIFNLLVLVGAVKMANNVVRDMLGLHA